MHAELRASAEDLARRAGVMAMAAFRAPKAVSYKQQNEIVTDTDVAIERMLRDELQRRYPSHRVVGEELGKSGEDSAPFTWYLDPIDGTRNFASEIPHFNISIGIREGEHAVAGAVFDPVHDRMYTAHAGGGATCNGATMRVPQTPALENALIILDYHRSSMKHVDPRALLSLYQRAYRIRQFGAVALDLCYVAAGLCDALMTMGNVPYKMVDLVAGVCILREAGGVLRNLNDTEFSWRSPSFTAANPVLVRNIVETCGNLHPDSPAGA